MGIENSWLGFLSFMGAIAGSSAWLAWFISTQFSANRKAFYRIMSVHNKEDDDRFEALKQDIWQLRLRNARVDGVKPPEQQSFPRRRYLGEDGDIDTLGESA